jgi:hypothetical protein
LQSQRDTRSVLRAWFSRSFNQLLLQSPENPLSVCAPQNIAAAQYILGRNPDEIKLKGKRTEASEANDNEQLSV